MKHLFLILIFFFSSQTFTQTETMKDTAKNNSLQEEKWALLFQVTDNFSLRSFNGSLVSGDYHFLENTFLRVGVGINGSLSNAESNVSSTSYGEDNQENKNKGFGVTIISQYFYYWKKGEKVKLFYGAGPFVGISFSTEKTIRKRFNGSSYDEGESKRSSTNLSFGVSGAIGVEWFASNDISFLGQYESSLGYSWTKTITKETRVNSNDNQERTDKGNRFNLSNPGLKIGMAIYF